MKKLLLSVFIFSSVNVFADCPGLSVIINTYPVSCAGGCDGGGITSVSGGSGSYNVNYYDGGFTLVGSGTNVSNLCAGIYNIVVEDITNACFDTTQFTLVNPTPVTGVMSQTNITCNGGCNGSMSAIVTGGSPPYAYFWSGPNSFTSSSVNIVGLCAGTYICFVTDSQGCSYTITGVISQPNPVVVSTGSAPSTCGLCDGTATASSTGGTGSIIYMWDDPSAQTTPTATSLCSGNYIVTGTDVNGCTGSATAFVGSAGMAATATNVVMSTCNQCNGSADIIVTGGTGPYTYMMDSVQNSTGIYTGLCPGVHIATVTDNLGCITYYTLTIGSSSTGSMTFTSVVTDETGYNMNDGSIDVTVSGGVGPYTYVWSNGATTEDIFSLSSGFYVLWVTDSNGDCNYFTITVGTVSNFGVITGIVYNDNNQNCVYDAGDVPLSGQWVQAGSNWGYTNASGIYSITVIAGNYTVLPLNTTNITSGCQSSQNLTVTNGGTVSADFSMDIPPVYNVCIYTYSLGIVPGFAGSYTIGLYSTGNMTADGNVCFVLPADLDYTGASPAPSSVNGDTICWTYTGLGVGTIMNFSVQFQTPVSLPLGTSETACITSTITNGTASNPSCGQVCYTRLVTGSFDPNEKSVSPTGENSTGDVQLTEDELTYLIQFQNTGTGPAVNITVTDTLSPLLDLTTFEMLNSSHNYTVDFFNGNVIRWKFENINLPDSGSNEALSHGQIQFKIRTQNAPVPGQVVNNTANIYFDFNAPVITNTTINTYVMPDGVNELQLDGSIALYPNPASSTITLSTSSWKGKNIPIKITDVAGRKVGEFTLTGNSITTDISAYESGIYFMIATIDGKINTIPFVISK